MAPDTLLSNKKISRIFFRLLHGNCRLASLVRDCNLDKDDCDKLTKRMIKTGLINKGTGGVFEIDWERFVPLFISRAMNIYSAAMPWKYVPYYVERDPENVIESACARAERELAKTKVILADNEAFSSLVQEYFMSLATEVDAPEDYLADLRLQDAVDEFEYALLKIFPLLKRSRTQNEQSRRLRKELGKWYKQIQEYDNTPTGAALRSAFRKVDLL